MGMERRGEQSISLSMSRIAEMTTSAVTNRVKGGQIKRDGKERTHGHKLCNEISGAAPVKQAQGLCFYLSEMRS